MDSFFNSGSGKRVFLQPMGTPLNKVAKNVTIVGLQNFHFVFACSLVHNSLTFLLFDRFLIFVRSSVVVTKLDLSDSVFFCVHNFIYHSRFLRL